MAEIGVLSVVAGEAPVALCGMYGALMVLNVMTRNAVWYGRGAPTGLEAWAVGHWGEFPDVSRGGTFLFSLEDLRTEYVRNLLRDPRIVLVAVTVCRGGLALFSYAVDGDPEGGIHVCYAGREPERRARALVAGDITGRNYIAGGCRVLGIR